MVLRTRIISFLWGFCEATFFFIVPDVWLSRIVLKDRKEACVNIAITTMGALLGGLVMYGFAVSGFERLHLLLDYVPAVSGNMVDSAGYRIQEVGFLSALFEGSASGAPYKIYASWAGYLELSLGGFLLASALVRTVRFVIVTGIAHLAALILKPYVKNKGLYMLHAASWIIFYMGYFYVFGF